MTKQVFPQISMTLGANVRAARLEAQLTQRELGDLVGVENVAVWRWENGRGRPTENNLARLCVALGKDHAWFYTDHGHKAAA